MGDFEKTDKQKKLEKLRYLKNTLCTEKGANSYRRYLQHKDMEAQRAKNASVINKRRK